MPKKFTAFTKSATIRLKLNQQITHIKDLLKYMEIEISGSEVTERNYVSVLILLIVLIVVED